jgi:hypothetical protein
MYALVAEKNPGFSTTRLAEALTTVDRYDVADIDIDDAALRQTAQRGRGLAVGRSSNGHLTAQPIEHPPLDTSL